MLKKILSLVSSKKKPQSGNALYDLVTNPKSKTSRKILERAGRMANEEQRKVYYGHTKKNEA